MYSRMQVGFFITTTTRNTISRFVVVVANSLETRRARELPSPKNELEGLCLYLYAPFETIIWFCFQYRVFSSVGAHSKSIIGLGTTSVRYCE